MKNKKIALLLAAVMTLSTVLTGCGGSSGASSNAGAASEESAASEDTSAAEDTTAAEDTAAEDTSAEEEAPAAGEASGEPVTLTFMHDWPEYTAEFEEMVAEFEAENPNITVETQIITWDVMNQTLLTNFANDELPDVCCCWSNDMGQFSNMGMVLDVTSYMDENGGEWRNSLLKPAVDLGTVNGSVYAVPYRTTQTVLAYNKDMMDENGWKEPTTLEEFTALCDEILASGKDVLPLLAPGNPDGFQFSVLVNTFGEQDLYKKGILQQADYLTGHVTDVAESWEVAGDTMKDWIAKGYLSQDGLAMTREETVAQFFTGKGVFTFLNNNELSEIEAGCEEAGFTPGFMAFPVPEGMEFFLYNFGVDAFMASAKTEHPEEAVKFLKFLTNTEQQQKFGVKTLSIMANKDVKYENANQNTFSEIFSKASSYRINYDYPAGNLGTDINVAIADFIADPSATGADLGAKIQKLREDCLAENGQ